MSLHKTKIFHQVTKTRQEIIIVNFGPGFVETGAEGGNGQSYQCGLSPAIVSGNLMVSFRDGEALAPLATFNW